MPLEVPPKPLPLRIFNALGRLPSGLGLRLPSLNAERLQRRARRSTGLSDFGDARFEAPLRLLLESFEHDAGLTQLGRIIARNDILRLLENRLRIVEAHKRNPELGNIPVQRPWFIIGLPRTGTTILHALLAQDPANRVPMTWEVMHPWPPPERATYATDPRIAQVDQHFSGIDKLLPGFKAVHPMGAQLPQECVAFTAHDFASMLFSTTHEIPAYDRWLQGADLRWVYASHRRTLQYLAWRCPAERWVLKSPAHLWALDALLNEYPDACIIQTHRDPLKVLASLTSLMLLLRSLASDRADPHAIASTWSPRLAQGLERCMAVRAGRLLPAARVFDIDFRQFVGNEIATIRRLYTHFDSTLSSEAEQRMIRFLADNPADKHGVHRYRLADAGIDVATERPRFAAYQKAHAVESEPA